MLIWLAFLPHAGQAASAPDAGLLANQSALYGRGRVQTTRDPSPTPAPTPDPRWVEIVRARVSGRASPEAQALSMNLNLTDGFVAGRVPAAAWVDITILDQGELIDETTVMPVFDGAGFLYFTQLGIYYFGPGYEVWVTQGASVISMTVPTLTGLAYPQTDILSGTAPANADLTAYLLPYANPDEVYTHTATASAAGVYLIDWSPAVDLHPRDSGYLLYALDDAHQASVLFAAPFLRVQVGGSEISGVAAPSAYYGDVSIVVEDASGAQLGEFQTYNYSNGSFSTQACVWDESCLILAPTDRVIVTAGGQTFSMTVVTLTARPDREAGQVSGQAPALQPVEVLRFRGPLGAYGNIPIWYQTPLERVVVTATLDGEYAASMPFQAGNYGAALVATPEEDQCFALYAVPYVHAMLGKRPESNSSWVRMWGNVSEPLVPITVEIQGPSVYLKDWYTLATQKNGYFEDQFDPNSDLSLESGDRITVTTPGAEQIALQLPVLTVEADPATNILSGLAPPFAQLLIVFTYSPPLTVTADANGQYSLDLSGLGGFDMNPSGDVEWTSPEGYTVERFYNVATQGKCPPALGPTQIGGNEVDLNGIDICTPLTFRLRSAAGGIKFEYTFDWEPTVVQLYDENGAPVLIAIGDQIELATSGQTNTFVVPSLTAVLDPQHDQVSGQAPPNSIIGLNILYGPGLTTTANTQGVYTADLAGIVDLDAGSVVQVTLEGDPGYYLYGVLPALFARLYENGTYGELLPFTPYTITLHTPVTVTAPFTGRADNTGNFSNYLYPPPEGIPVAQPGDRVEMETPTRLWELTLPWLTARVDPSTGVVSGEAPPDSRLGIMLLGECNCNTVVTATTSGTYSAILPVPAGTTQLRGILTHYTSVDTRTVLNFGTSHWSVTLGSGQVSGNAPMFDTPISLTLRSASGAFSQTIIVTDTVYGGSFDVEFERLVQPGDRLTMETVEGLVNEFTVPYLSAVYDFPRRVLEGLAPVGGKLVAHIPGVSSVTTRHARVAPNGHYGVDASDVVPLIGGQGWIFYTDRFGNTVTRTFYILGYPQYLPVIRCLATAP